ncbi:PAS domain-containing sensor histidine kinase [Myxosarcina sp. GI1]|uniref:sensor histidine kinase n=1 Tax=Myxosarcina sp. GI1 TaxID=1541065 RepID=UPI000907804B|nr:PAS domain-containing sensor histidine kinase [Myxosarcina sp. GI1]
MMPESPKLREEEPFFSRYLVNHLPDAVFCLGADARFLYLNDAACRLLEYSRQELLSMKLSDIDPDCSQKTWLEQWQSLKQQSSLVIQSRHRTRSGKLLPVELILTYVRNRDQDFSCAFVRRVEKTQPTQDGNLFDRNGSINNLYQEISQLTETESQLAKTLSLVRGTLDSTAYGTVAVSDKGEVLGHNQKFLEMWQIPDSLVLSKDSEECQNFFARQLKNPEVFRRSVWEISRESEAETFDILELKDGRVFAQYSNPQRLGDKIIGRVWSIWDLTELKQQTEEELQKNQDKIETVRAVEEAKQLSELRSRFLSMLCHQFRSSLNIISFSNSLLKRYVNRWTDDKKLPYLNNIQTAVEQIAELLDEVVFFGKSEVGQIEFEPNHIDLADFCRELAAQIEPISDDKQQNIEFTSCGNCKAVWIDKNMLHHILTNLLSNAIKYSPNGSKIKFEVFCDRQQAVIKVKDKGIGISAIDQQRLFDPFFRGSNVDNIPGNGLGLSIAKNLAEIHGGKIEVESKLGIGTTFSLTLAARSLEDGKQIAEQSRSNN